MLTEVMLYRLRRSAVLAVLVFCATLLPTVKSLAGVPFNSTILANSNRTPAGAWENGVLVLHLELRPGEWYPEAETGPSLKVYAFAEEGKAAQVRLATVSMMLGDMDQALAAMEKISKKYPVWGEYLLKASPRFDDLHTDPRFSGIHRRAESAAEKGRNN